MKKASGRTAAVKPAKTSYYSFVDEFHESRQLQERLNEIVQELHETVGLLEQNLQKAHLFARPQRRTWEKSGTKTGQGKNE
jgi:hypothetical protein